jgi:hypothetical protein
MALDVLSRPGPVLTWYYYGSIGVCCVNGKRMHGFGCIE